LLAQYGFRDQTRLDKTVRGTWGIPKGRIKIDQARWNRTLVPELDRIREELGLGSQCRLRAELHNLLVYAPGQFVVPHQDSEKEDDMTSRSRSRSSKRASGIGAVLAGAATKSAWPDMPAPSKAERSRPHFKARSTKLKSPIFTVPFRVARGRYLAWITDISVPIEVRVA
jgi:hypothetical protein